MNTKRAWLAAASLLTLLTFIWFLVLHLPIWSMADPAWVVSGANQNYESCELAAQLATYNAHAITDESRAAISRDEAFGIVDHTLARYYGIFLFPSVYGHGPNLVEATFPDDQTRLAWYKVVMLDDGGGGLLGRATAVYVDAQSGDPLLLITSVTVGDPQMVCITDDLTLAPLGRLLSLLLTISGVALIGFITIVIRPRANTKD